jgi:hypothetical protein
MKDLPVTLARAWTLVPEPLDQIVFVAALLDERNLRSS